MAYQIARAEHQEIFPESRFNKGTIRSDYIKLCGERNLIGSSFWLAGDSCEILEYLEATGADPSTVWNCEVDPRLHYTMWDLYTSTLGCRMGRAGMRLHEILPSMSEPIVYGHADFIGNVGSRSYNATATYTFDLIDALVPRLSDEALIAFTHRLHLRAGSTLVREYVNLIYNFNQKFSVGLKINFHPAYLVGLYLATVTADSNIVLHSSRDYTSTRIKSSLKMNKSVYEITKGEFNAADFITQMKRLPVIE